MEQQEQARENRLRAEEEADEKLIKAVCAASLVEYNECQRIEKASLKEAEERSLRLQHGKESLLNEKDKSRRDKTAAISNVLNAKSTAFELKVKAQEAVALFEAKERLRVEKQSVVDIQRVQVEKEEQLRQVKLRQQEAMTRREEAEKKAALAQAKAAELRLKAIQATAVLREKSRSQTEITLQAEHEARERQLLAKKAELQNCVANAKSNSSAAQLAAQTALKRAEELRAKAMEAAGRVQEKRNVSPAAFIA